MKRLLSILVVAVLIVALTMVIFACKAAPTEKEEAAPAEKITIGYSMPFIEDSPYCFPFFKYLQKS